MKKQTKKQGYEKEQSPKNERKNDKRLRIALAMKRHKLNNSCCFVKGDFVEILIFVGNNNNNNNNNEMRKQQWVEGIVLSTGNNIVKVRHKDMTSNITNNEKKSIETIIDTDIPCHICMKYDTASLNTYVQREKELGIQISQLSNIVHQTEQNINMLKQQKQTVPTKMIEDYEINKKKVQSLMKEWKKFELKKNQSEEIVTGNLLKYKYVFVLLYGGVCVCVLREM